MNVIETRGLSKQFARFALKDVSLEIKQGFITGLIGPNGAGKSTLIRLLMGMAVPGAGEIRIFGKPMPADEAAIRERIGFVSEECNFYEHLSIAAMKRVIAPFYGRWDDKRFNDYLERFELHPKAKIRSLSKGMKMKLSLCFALSRGADLLVMDEPTAGLDPVFRRELLDILADLMLDEGHSILFSSHITTDLDRIADYIVFIHQGKLVFNESRERVFEKYALVKAAPELLDRDVRKLFVGIRETAIGFEGLTERREEALRLFGKSAVLEKPTLEDIMFFTAKGGRQHD
ncbi:ABC transporter ATP-binding protein [Cohnella algarum]|uniref:ABC transporter ATP-binding protein n=1 Tax=Cohnella algarum TaxID=2044859 RepID=UPI001967E1D4|nr:ABC transporter ATP-binding protein [Cohnella algarum]MBN2981402.1 ABC transporter ATP-binding protein [Cohnella algarum]